MSVPLDLPLAAILHSNWSAISCGKSGAQRRHMEPSALRLHSASRLQHTCARQRSPKAWGPPGSCSTATGEHHSSSDGVILMKQIVQITEKSLHSAQRGPGVQPRSCYNIQDQHFNYLEFSSPVFKGLLSPYSWLLDLISTSFLFSFMFYDRKLTVIHLGF